MVFRIKDLNFYSPCCGQQLLNVGQGSLKAGQLIDLRIAPSQKLASFNEYIKAIQHVARSMNGLQTRADWDSVEKRTSLSWDQLQHLFNNERTWQGKKHKDKEWGESAWPLTAVTKDTRHSPPPRSHKHGIIRGSSWEQVLPFYRWGNENLWWSAH